MELKFTPELLEKVKAVKSEEELLSMMKENGIEVNSGEAKTLFAKLKHLGEEVSDEKLDEVSGGMITKIEDVISKLLLDEGTR